MSFLSALIWMCITGLFVGAFARLALPGPDPMGIPTTIAIGIAGSFIGGTIGYLVYASVTTVVLLSIAAAALIVYLIRRSRGGGLTDPGIPPE